MPLYLVVMAPAKTLIIFENISYAVESDYQPS